MSRKLQICKVKRSNNKRKKAHKLRETMTDWQEGNKKKKLTLKFLTNKAIPALAALLIVPFPSEVEIVVVWQNSAEGFIGSPTEPVILLRGQHKESQSYGLLTSQYVQSTCYYVCTCSSVLHANLLSLIKTSPNSGAYSKITLWFNWRPVGVADWFPIGPFHCVLISQTDPHTYRASLEQHGDVGCRNQKSE